MEINAKLKEILKYGQHSWRVAPCARDSRVIQWITITEIPLARIILGLSTDAEWLRVNTDSVSVCDQSYVPFLPVLEVDEPEFWQHIRKGMLLQGIAEEFASSFPINQVILEGLNSYSEHWSWRALQWIYMMSTCSVFASALEKTATSGRSQPIRHLARKIICKMERGY